MEREQSTIPEYTSHPITEFFPRMTPTAYAELKADIQANGQQVPIVVLEQQILDGRHRYQACRELGIAPKVIDATGDPFLLVQSLNLRRRHLTADQIAAFHRRVRQEHPALNQKLEAIQQAARARQTGALKHGDMIIPRRLPGKPTEKTGRTAARVAAEIGSTKTAVEQVERVAREHPTALVVIEAGEVTAKQVLAHGGAAKAKAAKAAGLRVVTPAKKATPAKIAADIAATDRRGDTKDQFYSNTYRADVFAAFLGDVLAHAWATARSRADKQTLVQHLVDAAEEYEERLRSGRRG